MTPLMHRTSADAADRLGVSWLDWLNWYVDQRGAYWPFGWMVRLAAQQCPEKSEREENIPWNNYR